jgi:membrane protease YdiL (CAAX protease family)
MDMKAIIKNHPYKSAIILFLVYSLLPIPVVIIFKLLNLDLEPLRLFFPILMSIYAIVVLYYLGWLRLSGFGKKIQDIDVLWFLLVIVFVPAALFGTIEIAANLVLFYLLAVLFTGISEEALYRGIMINVMIPKGKWTAILFSAALFSVSHFSNLFFENFTVIEMIEKLWLTFSSGILYGVLYLRIRNIWPLIILHTMEDFIFVISGTAGPFTVVPLPTYIHMIIGALSIAYAIYIVRKVNITDILPELEKASSG